MARYSIPSNSGKFTVVVAGGGHYCVWNRKHGRNEVSVPVKTKKQAMEICEMLNKKQHDGTIEVLG